MSRPKMANLKTFPLYNLLHTIKQKMYSGVYLTILHSLKENSLYYTSIEVWAFCASRFKANKGKVLNVNIPEVNDTKVVEFLNEHMWKDWMEKNKDDSDMIETLAALDRLFPDKEKVYFYELDSIISAYVQGTFIKFDDNGNIEEMSEHQIDLQKYYTHKYNRFVDDQSVLKLRDKWTNEKNEELRKKYIREYLDSERDFAFKHLNLTDVFINIGQNAVCYPFIFTKNTAEWSKKEYGKLIDYAHAGEIWFVVTPEKVFFNLTRHF